jgi:hypothetical protein
MKVASVNTVDAVSIKDSESGGILAKQRIPAPGIKFKMKLIFQYGKESISCLLVMAVNVY